MITKREPVGVRCVPIRQGNGTYYVHMRRTEGSRPHSDGEYFGNGRFTVQRKPDGDVVRAAQVEDDAAATAASTRDVWTPTVQVTLTLDDPAFGDLFIQYFFDEPFEFFNPYPAGHEFWLVIKVNGVEIVPSDHPDHLVVPGDVGGDLVVPPLPSGTFATVEVSVYYDSTLGNLVCRATETATTS